MSQIRKAFGNDYLFSLQPFRDAGIGPDDYPITVVDCLIGLQRAIELNWYNYKRFDIREFERMLDHGDLSWIVPGKIIACSSPVSTGYSAPHGGIRPNDMMDSL